MTVSSPGANYTQEVRFAVVMYGGVSLAIYINGIAQELLRLVRATAKKDLLSTGTKPPTGTETVYRKVSYLLADEVNGLNRSEADLNDPKAIPPTRFVVDILSGTSAGGINGIFLAKALANGQDMEQLKELWVQEGDINSLINDTKSIEKPLSLQDPPTSLLNSERMYLELLKAFDGMDRASGKRSENFPSPFVDELDLFVTATDLQGVVLPIRLADDVVYERRHRNVLHFLYSLPAVSGEANPRNDFSAEYNPFLAYAARCTSAFPFAFEPMCLCDTDKILWKLTEYRGNENCKSTSDAWQKFYKDYLDPRGVSTVPFPKRAFGDGGYLDNKPFSYATETLMNRHADVPVDRKLIYIEPSPEHPEDDVEREDRPDAIDNVMSALLTLPRYETIREDLQRVIDRNRLIARINRIMAGVDRDIDESRIQGGPFATDYEAWLQLGALVSPPTAKPWARDDLTDGEMGLLDLADMIKRKGRGYAAYYRLRIAAVTDDLAILVARVAGFDENSDYFLILRSVVWAWRNTAYVEYRSANNEARPTMNQFLFHFDLSYSLRRINYLRNKVDLMYRLDEQALETIGRGLKEFSQDVERGLSEVEKDAVRVELSRFKRTLNDVFVSLRREARTLRARRAPRAKLDAKNKGGSPAYEEITNLVNEMARIVKDEVRDPESSSPMLDYFLGKEVPKQPFRIRLKRSLATGESEPITSPQPKRGQLEDECARRAGDFLEWHPEIMRLFDVVAETLRSRLVAAKEDAEQKCILLFSSENTSPDSVDAATSAAQSGLYQYYRKYEEYDMITYPILYDTDVGEADAIEIIRVSPEDAKQLINERESHCHKLAGTALGHFGAFLEKLWRQNDILWGRLDGAERIITSLIPDHPLRPQLIGEAHAEIVCDTIETMGEDERYELLAESLMRTRTRKPEPEILEEFVEQLKNGCNNPGLRKRLDSLIDNRKLRQFYLDHFSVSSRAEPETTLRSAARATTVVGKMLEALSSRRRVNSKYAAWIARLGQIFWALVEVAVPRSVPNLIFRHWLKLVYFLEALLIALSTLLLSSEVQRFALTAFAVTAAIHLAVVILGDLMQSRNRWINLVKAIGGVALVALLAIGVFTLSAVFGMNASWKVILGARAWSLSSPPLGWNTKTYVRLAVVGCLWLLFVWVIRDDLKALFRAPKKK